MRRFLLLAALASAPVTANPFGDAAAVADTELGTMRGGIELPGGITAAIGVALETRVDGRLAVRTEISTEVPGVRVFADGVAARAGGTTVQAGGSPSISIARNGAGTTITVVPAMPVTPIRIGGTTASTSQPLPLTPGGPGVTTALGTISLVEAPGGFVTQLSGPTIAVQQLLGQAVGTVVANNADNRVIDTVTNIDVTLMGQVLPGDIAANIGRLFGGVR